MCIYVYVFVYVCMCLRIYVCVMYPIGSCNITFSEDLQYGIDKYTGCAYFEVFCNNETCKSVLGQLADSYILFSLTYLLTHQLAYYLLTHLLTHPLT